MQSEEFMENVFFEKMIDGFQIIFHQNRLLIPFPMNFLMYFIIKLKVFNEAFFLQFLHFIYSMLHDLLWESVLRNTP